MARKVFFSFHYSRDSHRISQIRNSNAITRKFTESRFLDKAQWESIKRKGSLAIREWIDDNMHGTSVVVVCYGLETFTRPWVKYELEKAHRDGRGILAIDMSGMKNLAQQSDSIGQNPLLFADDGRGTALYYYDRYKTYSWLNFFGQEYGRYHIDDWIELAATLVGR